jgi:hypothetical protein
MFRDTEETAQSDPSARRLSRPSLSQACHTRWRSRASYEPRSCRRRRLKKRRFIVSNSSKAASVWRPPNSLIFCELSKMEQRSNFVRSKLSPSPPIRHLPVTESVVLPPDVRDDIMGVLYGPSCPKCKTITMLARITPGASGFDIRRFERPACGQVHQRVVELVDPMKSRETAGWLQGELQAPT